MDLWTNILGGLALVGVAIVVAVWLSLRKKGKGDLDVEIERRLDAAIARLGHPLAQRACPECAKRDAVIAAQKKVLDAHLTSGVEIRIPSEGVLK